MSDFMGSPMADAKGYLTPEEVITVISHARNLRDRLLMRILWATGCRLNEMLMLEVDDISWGDNALYLWTLKRKKKRRYQRLVPVDEITLDLIREYMQVYRVKKGRLFNITDRRVQQIVYEAGVVAGIPKVGSKKFHPHHFRHSHCVAWVRENSTMEGLRTLQQRVGHASINTTAHYLQFAARQQEETVQKLFTK